MEHVVYLTVKKGNRGSREPVTVERLRMEQMHLSRVTLLEAYLAAWQQPSHVCGVIWDKIKERCVEESGREREGAVDGGGTGRCERDSAVDDGGTGRCERDSAVDGGGTGRCERDSAVDGGDMQQRESVGRRSPYVPGLRELHRYFPDYQVWDRSFQGYLERHQMTSEWLRVWRIPVFDQYGGSEQLQILMKRVEGWQQLSQILVLGYDSDILTWLPRLARRTRGIDFYLEYEPRDMEEIREWIDEEYGLVTQWRILESREQSDDGQGTGQEETKEKKVQHYPGLNQYLHSYAVPCLVIDFTDMADIPMTGLKSGSMWWDMGAMEKKRHLLEDRPLGVRYVSLRTLWRDLV